MHKQECEALQRWFQAAPSSDVAPPSDAVRCIARILWKRKKKGLEDIWVSRGLCFHFLHSYINGITRAKKSTTCSPVSSLLTVTQTVANFTSDRTSMQPSSFETNTHLAQALVQYMGISSPADLAQFGLMSAADLVDLISRVSFENRTRQISRNGSHSYTQLLVHHKQFCHYRSLIDTTGRVGIANRRFDQSFLRSKCCGSLSSSITRPQDRRTVNASHCYEGYPPR
jgi:hypothetical protein